MRHRILDEKQTKTPSIAAILADRAIDGADAQSLSADAKVGMNNADCSAHHPHSEPPSTAPVNHVNSPRFWQGSAHWHFSSGQVCDVQ
jgi:hypothetical protein